MTSEKTLTLTKFEVYGLFDNVEYQMLDFSNQNIVILYGPNGVGKTTILKLIHFFKQGIFDEIAKIKFNKVIFHFDRFEEMIGQATGRTSQGKLSIEIVNNLNNELTISFLEESDKKPSKTYKFSFPGPLYEILRARALGKEIRSPIADLEFESKDNERNWFVHAGGIRRRLSKDDLNLYFHNLKTLDVNLEKVNQYKEFAKKFSEIQKAFNCHFIPAERLNVQNLNLKRDESKKITSVIQHKSTILTEKIQENFDNYVKISQARDKDLISRVIGSIESQVRYSYQEVLVELEKFEKHQREYAKAGLDMSGVAKDIDFRSPLEKSREWEDQNQAQLLYRMLKNVIYRDRWAKLKVFTSLKNKIELLMTIVNEHLKGKYLEIHHEKGLVLKIEGSNEELDVNLLSSGEMNMIILFFELIFETKKDTLIMIDEPEISMHIEWQVRFVENLMILQKSNILLATHSPQIIHDHWDLTIELTLGA